jgi:PiT family inorganic phosphate transporter
LNEARESIVGNVASSIVYAWVITIPASAIVAAAAYWLVSAFR